MRFSLNIESWLRATKNRIDSLDAELICLNVLKEKDRSFLFSHSDLVLSYNDLLVLEKMVRLRERKMPIAYILGFKEFYGRDFSVSRDVLIPRVETEDIVDITKDIVKKDSISCPRILDIGTGSGCIAISLALEIPDAKVFGVDNSKDALMVAYENALNLNARVDFFYSDLLSDAQNEKFDIIIANLPYVDKSWDFISEELEWEPKEALFAEDGGLEIIYRLLDEVKEYQNTKYLILESDDSQLPRIKKYAEKLGFSVVSQRGFTSVICLDKLPK